MSYCMCIQTAEWMKKVYGIDARGCTYNKTSYCKYWKECATELNISWFRSGKLNALFQMHKDEIIAQREAIAIANAQKREAIAKKKLMRKQTRVFTFRKRKKKIKF